MKYFKVQELVSKAIYQKEGDLAVKHINPKLIEVLEWVRKELNLALIVNNWSYGGSFQYRGYREPECKIGAKNSQHKQGNAVDFHSVVLTPKEIRGWIKKNEDGVPHPIRLEEDVNWVHIDLANKGSRRVETFKP